MPTGGIPSSSELKKPTAERKEETSSSENTTSSESEITVGDWEIISSQMLNTAVCHANIATLDTAADAWQALKDMYERKTANTKASLLKTVLNRKLEDGASMHDHKKELNRKEKAHRVSKETTDDNSSTIATAFMVSPAPSHSVSMDFRQRSLGSHVQRSRPIRNTAAPLWTCPRL